jgi:hypothetical protein
VEEDSEMLPWSYWMKMETSESRYIEGSVGNGQVVQKVFNEETSLGRYVQVSFKRVDCLHMGEVKVYGYHLMA